MAKFTEKTCRAVRTGTCLGFEGMWYYYRTSRPSATNLVSVCLVKAVARGSMMFRTRDM